MTTKTETVIGAYCATNPYDDVDPAVEVGRELGLAPSLVREICTSKAVKEYREREQARRKAAQINDLPLTPEQIADGLLGLWDGDLGAQALASRYRALLDGRRIEWPKEDAVGEQAQQLLDNLTVVQWEAVKKELSGRSKVQGILNEDNARRKVAKEKRAACLAAQKAEREAQKAEVVAKGMPIVEAWRGSIEGMGMFGFQSGLESELRKAGITGQAMAWVAAAAGIIAPPKEHVTDIAGGEYSKRID